MFTKNLFGQQAPLSVATGDLADGSVVTSKLANGAVTSDKIAGGAIIQGKIPDNSVPLYKIIQEVYPPFVPAVTQGASITIAAGYYAKYFKIGRRVELQFKLSFTSAGTAANRILLTGIGGYTIATTGAGHGIATLYRGGTRYVCMAESFTTTSFGFDHDTSTTDLLGITPAVTIANGDVLWGTIAFEATT